jgi:hypothetical protein
MNNHRHPANPPLPCKPEMIAAASRPPKQLDSELPEYMMAILTASSFLV